MQIKACGARVVIRPDKLKETDKAFSSAVKAGIFIPESDEKKREQEALDKGTVIMIGPLAWYDWGKGDPWCQVGDRVLFAKYAGKKVGNTDFRILNDEGPKTKKNG